jgi:hypothetical protein
MLPNLLIIGGMKCGTTSLHRYLAAHPEIFMSKEKELEFFTSWNQRELGLAWYEQQFPEAAPIRGESSPVYTAWPHVLGVPEAIRATLPEVKLIYVVRDPVARTVSHYLHAFGRGDERRALADVATEPEFAESGYVAQSRYAMQLERYLELFDSSDVLVLQQEALDADRAATLRTAFRFLGVDEEFSSSVFQRRYNVARDERRSRRIGQRLRVPQPVQRGIDRLLSRRIEKPPLPPAVRERLVDLLTPDTQRLVELTDLQPTVWSTWESPPGRRTSGILRP